MVGYKDIGLLQVLRRFIREPAREDIVAVMIFRRRAPAHEAFQEEKSRHHRGMPSGAADCVNCDSTFGINASYSKRCGTENGNRHVSPPCRGASNASTDIRLGDVVVSSLSERHGGVINCDNGRTSPRDPRPCSLLCAHSGALTIPPSTLPVIAGSIGGKVVKGIADMGSPLNLMSAQFAKRLGFNFSDFLESSDPTEKQLLSCLNHDGTVSIHGTVIEDWRFDGLQDSAPLQMTWTVIEGLPDDIVLGRSFVLDHGLGKLSFEPPTAGLGPELTPICAPTESEMPQVFYGTVASADNMVKCGVGHHHSFDESEHPPLIVHMEPAGCDYPYSAVRGISNYPDSHKATHWASIVGKGASELDDRHDGTPRHESDHNDYQLGRIGIHDVVLACLPPGAHRMTSATSVVSLMCSANQLLYQTGPGERFVVSLDPCDLAGLDTQNGTLVGETEYDPGKGFSLARCLLDKAMDTMARCMDLLSNRSKPPGTGMEHDGVAWVDQKEWNGDDVSVDGDAWYEKEGDFVHNV